MSSIIPTGNIESRIFVIRGHKVMIDIDLAELYLVETKALNQAVKRNQERFPERFAFRLTREETEKLFQTNRARFSFYMHSPSLPLVFTEYGIAMLSGILHSKRAVRINIQIIETFIRLREWALTHKELAEKIDALEHTVR